MQMLDRTTRLHDGLYSLQCILIVYAILIMQTINRVNKKEDITETCDNDM